MANVLRAWRHERERFSVLALVGILAAVVSLAAVGLLLARPTLLPLAPLLMLLQIAVISCIIGARAVTSRRVQALEDLAEHDPATGCLNRRGFARALDSALTRALQGNGEVANGASITMSVGIAAERVSSLRDSAALRARSDEALYLAKRCGRDRVYLWAPGVRSLATPAAYAAAITRPPIRSGSSSLWH
jgi:predicted signal transduction protein with EAL and GGDEF domain